MKLGILERILPPPEKKFYSLFEDGAGICAETAKLYHQIINSDEAYQEDHLIQAKTLKRMSSNISKENLALLNASFITPIDREDIQLISSLLSRISKSIVKSCINLKIYNIDHYNGFMKKQSDTLLKATEELKNVINLLKKGPSLKEVTECHHRMKEIENHGDEILYQATQELYSGAHDALHVLKMRDIYKNIENALDICSAISDEIVNIVLKHD